MNIPDVYSVKYVKWLSLGYYWLGTEDWIECLPLKSSPANGSKKPYKKPQAGGCDRSDFRGTLVESENPPSKCHPGSWSVAWEKNQRRDDISAVFWKLSRSFPSQDLWLGGRYIPGNQFHLCRKCMLLLNAWTTCTGYVSITCQELYLFPELDKSEKVYSSLW